MLNVYMQVDAFLAACEWSFRIGVSAEKRAAFEEALVCLGTYGAEPVGGDYLTPGFKLENFKLNLEIFCEFAKQVLDAEQATRVEQTIRLYIGQGLTKQ